MVKTLKGTQVELPDVAAEFDPRGIRLPAVGIRSFRLPLQMANDQGEIQTVIADAEVGVSVEAEQRGAHMSRLVESLYRWSESPRSRRDLNELLQEVAQQLRSDFVNLSLHFAYFLPQPAPVTHSFGLIEAEVEWDAILYKGTMRSGTHLVFPAMTLCPCSKAISEHNAHNQRVYIHLWLETQDRLPLLPEPFLPLVNEVASVGVYPVLKRPDEKYVTERAYEKPRFVEDVVRELAVRLREPNELVWFRIECESIESIHNHNAFASYEECKGK